MFNGDSIVAVFVDIGGQEGELATGYPVAPNLVMTARHTLFPVDAKVHGIELRWQGGDWIPLDLTTCIVWQDEAIDVVLLRCEYPMQEFGRLSRRKPVLGMQWESRGFAKVGKRGQKYPPTQLWGKMPSAVDSPTFVVGIDATTQLPDGWKGASGSPVFDDRGEIIGVIESCPENFHVSRLNVTAVYKLLEIPEFRALVQPEQAANPFGDAMRIDDLSRYFRREWLLYEVFDALRKNLSLSLLGERGTGKSSLLYLLQQLSKDYPQALGEFVYLNLQKVRSEHDFFALLCKNAGLPPHVIGLDLEEALQQKTAGKPLIVCLDNIECLNADSFTRSSREYLRALAEDRLLTLVIASWLPLEELFPDNSKYSSPLGGICQPINIGLFSEAEVKQFLATRLSVTPVMFSDEEIHWVYSESRGNPREVQRLAAQLYVEKIG